MYIRTYCCGVDPYARSYVTRKIEIAHKLRQFSIIETTGVTYFHNLKTLKNNLDYKVLLYYNI